MSENLLIVFVKYPAPGTVKLRLAQHIGAETAAAVYRQIAEAVIKNTVPYSAAGYTVEICFSPQAAETLLREWLSEFKKNLDIDKIPGLFSSIGYRHN